MGPLGNPDGAVRGRILRHPVHRGRALVLLAASALAVPVSGCTGGDPSDEAAVRAKVVELRDATRERRWTRLCGRILADTLLEEVREVGLSCEEAMRRAFVDVRDPALVIGAIAVDGDRASAEIRTSAAGQPPSRDVVELVRTPAGWRVTSLG